MKKMISILIAFCMIVALTGCSEDSNSHEGEAKTPSASSSQKGRNYKTVVEDFEKQGFINIKVIPLEDLIIGWINKDGDVKSVSVDGDEKYSPDKWYKNNVEVIIIYHTFPTDNDKKDPQGSNNSNSNDAIALEAVFPVENAKRAAVVVLTNFHAVDVFAPDGNSYDSSKFHSYKDTGGNIFDYLFTVNSWGNWSAKGKTWHVDSLKLENSLGVVTNISMDVKFDGNNYIASNIAGTFGNNAIDYENVDSIFLTVPPKLIKEDRSPAKGESHNKWVNSQFSSYDGSHKELKKIIVKNLNDEKSFKHINTTYLTIATKELKDEINKTLKANNKAERVEINDLWITTEFSGKNGFGATVKNTAFGIASYSNNTIILIAIE